MLKLRNTYILCVQRQSVWLEIVKYTFRIWIKELSALAENIRCFFQSLQDNAYT
jgi:hypothetical protein